MDDASRHGVTDGPDLSDKDLLARFESLGGTGHGWEFGYFQLRHGAEPTGLLSRADLGWDLLARALETRLAGVGERENTIVFQPEGSDEWWTKDTRYWMAMSTSVKASDVPLDRMIEETERKMTALRSKLIKDLGAGNKIFVYKNMFRNLTDDEVGRLHSSIRSYGDATFFYIRYADDTHPAGTVDAAAPGLLIGYIDHFEFSPENEYVGSAHAMLLALCRRAWALHAATLPATAPEPVPEPEPVRAAARPRPPVQRARRIVLFGNCQMQAMTQMYQRFVAGRTGDVLQHIESYKDLTEEGRAAIEQADLVVEQLLDLKPQADVDGISSSTPRLYVPMVTAAFLWPFAGQPHPKNASTPFLNGGPYGGEASDSYLNRLILAGMAPEEAVENYLGLDVRKRVNLDRLFELVMDRQRSRDEATGFDIASAIERHFRTEQIFLSPYHPNTRIAVALATRFFELLGAEQDDIERMRHRTRITPFPKTELPLHPAVCRHWGMDFIAPDRRYRFMNEGFFTFREYALRYMRYEWNDALEEGMALTHARDYHNAVGRLRAGLERSSESAAGFNALGHVLNQIGSKDEALEMTRRAVAIEPDSAAYRSNLGNLLRERGMIPEAEAELRQAITNDPTDPHYLVLLAHALRQRGDHDGAAEAARKAVALDPWAVNLRLDLAGILEIKGDWTGAIAVLEAAVAIDPANGQTHNRLAHALNRAKQNEQALSAARAAVEIDANSAAFRLTLSDCLLRLGRSQEALTQAYIAAVSDPNSAPAYAHLGHTLRTTGDLEAAEQAYRRAIMLQPDSAHLRHEISNLFSEMQRWPDAVAAAREAAERDPKNPNRRAHIAHVLVLAKDTVGAQAEQRLAVELAPDTVNLRLVLSDLLARDGKLAEALQEARTAVARAPGHPRALGHLAHILTLTGALEEADASLAKAMEIAPQNDDLKRQYALLQDRMGKRSAA